MRRYHYRFHFDLLDAGILLVRGNTTLLVYPNHSNSWKLRMTEISFVGSESKYRTTTISAGKAFQSFG